MAEITCRTVKRYYYKRKGYATKFQACRQLAKEELKDELFGPLCEWTRPHQGPLDEVPFDDLDGLDRCFSREKLAWLEGDESKAEVRRLMVERFWKMEYMGGCTGFTKVFDSEARREWLDNRAREIAQSVEVRNG